MEEIKLGGNSNPYGFEIYDNPFGWFGIKSRHYGKGNALLRGIQLSGLFVGVILMFLLFSMPMPISVIAFFVPTFITMNFSERIAMKIPKFRDNFQQWHAIEQKLVNLLTTRQELTLENLKKTPMTSPNCGEGNAFLQEPSEEKLEEALRVGQIFLKRRI